MTASTRDHSRKRGRQRRDRADSGDAKDRRGRRPIELRRVNVGAESGVGDHQVEPAERVPGPLDCGDRRFGIGDVELDDEWLAALLLDADGDLIEEALASRGDRDRVAALGEAFGEGATDSRRSSSDEGGGHRARGYTRGAQVAVERGMLRRSLVLSVFFAALVVSASARAETVEELDARLEHDLGAISAEAVQSFHDANKARLVGDHDKARALLGEVLKLAPDFAPAMRRACQADFELGHRAEAIALCRGAVARERAPLDDVTLAVVLTSSPTTPGDVAEARELARRGIEAAPSDRYIVTTACEAAQDADDAELIETAADLLIGVTDDPRELVCKAVAAATRNNLDEALRLAHRAERAGAPEDVVANLREGIQAARPADDRAIRTVIRAALIGLAVLGAWALFSVGLAALVRRQNRRDRAIGRVLSFISRFALWGLATLEVFGIGGFVATTAAMIAITAQRWVSPGPMPPALLAGVALISLATVGARKLTWHRDERPGLALDRAKHPALYRLVDEAAAAVGAPSVAAICLAPDVEVTAFERSGLAARLLVSGERCLVIGAGGLASLRASELAVRVGQAIAPLRLGGAGGAFARAILRAFGDDVARREGWWFSRILAFVFESASRNAIIADDRAAARRVAAAFDDNAIDDPAWNLFSDREALEQAMSE
jgi:tetratricopeptide (TPR) repeat protein